MTSPAGDPTSRYAENRDRQGDITRLWVIGAFALISLMVTIYAVTTQGEEILPQVYYLIPHLYIIPIILVSLWYPRRGSQVTLLLGAAIVALTVFFFYHGRAIDPVLSILNTGIDIWVVSALALLARCKPQTPVTDTYQDVRIGEQEEKRPLPVLEEPAAFTPSAPATVFNDSIAGYVEALRLKDEGIRIDAARALGASGDPAAIGPLIAALRDENRFVREEAAKSLGKIKDERAIALLLAALSDDARCVREGAVQALGNMGERAVSPLIGALADPDWHVRMGAAISLRIIGDQRAVPHLVGMIKDTNRFVRREAIKSLGRFGDPVAVSPLRQALGDEDEGVRIKAEAARRKITGEGRDPVDYGSTL